MNFLILVYISCLFKTVLTLTGDKLCSKRTQSGSIKDVCCSDYEEIDEVCRPCARGTSSDTGEQCRPCSDNSFGMRCSGECACNAFQRCDKTWGCVTISIPTLTTHYNTTGYSSSVQYKDSKSTDGTNENTREIRTKLFPDTDTATVKQSTEANKPGLSPRETIVYCTLAVTVCVLLTCLCFVFIKYRKVTKQRRLQLNASDEESNQHNIQRAELIEMGDSVYDIIDEAKLEDNVAPGKHNHDYLDIISGSTSTGSDRSSKVDRNSYLNPYQPLTQNDTVKHEYEKSPRILPACYALICKDRKTERYINTSQAIIENKDIINVTHKNVQLHHDTNLNQKKVIWDPDKTVEYEPSKDALLSGSCEFPVSTSDLKLNHHIKQSKQRSHSW